MPACMGARAAAAQARLIFTTTFAYNSIKQHTHTIACTLTLALRSAFALCEVRMLLATAPRVPVGKLRVIELVCAKPKAAPPHLKGLSDSSCEGATATR